MNSMICPRCGNLISYNSYFGAYYCSMCGEYFSESKKTNADKIRAMTDEELAEFLWNFNLADVSTDKLGEFGPHMFRHRLKEWLQRPAEEETL